MATMTLNAFIESMNQKYDLNLPVADQLDPDSLLHSIWELEVDVEHDAGSKTYRAQATAPISVFPGKPGTVFFTVSEDGALIN